MAEVELMDVVGAVTIASPIGIHDERGLQAFEPGKNVHFKGKYHAE
jgi:hypothetical protein